MRFPEWFYCEGSPSKDLTVHVSTRTPYNFNALMPAVWKLWCWKDVFLCHHKNGWSFLEQQINIQFYVKLGKNASNTCAVLSEAYGGEAMKKWSVSEWHKQFKELACWNHKWRQYWSLPLISTVLFTLKPFHKAKPSNQAYYVEVLKWLCETVHRKRPEIWPNNWILHHNDAPAHKVLYVMQFLAQKTITEMKHPSCYPDLVLNDFWLFPKIKSALKGMKISGYWRHYKI
jgi:hypothetical protein